MKRVVAQLEPAHLVGEAVVGDHRRDRREQAHRRGDQRLGDAGRDHRERRLLHVPEPLERAHDAPHRAEQADVRAGRADGRERRQVLLEPVGLAQLRHAHRAPRALEQWSRRRCPPACAAARTRGSPRRTRPPCRSARPPPSDLYSAARSPPDQNCSSKRSAARRSAPTSLRLRKMIAQETTDAPTSSAITNCTIRLACRIRSSAEWSPIMKRPQASNRPRLPARSIAGGARPKCR